MTDHRRSRYTNTIISTSKQRTWLPLFIGLAVGLVGIHFTVSRPMRKQWEKELLTVRKDLVHLQASVQKVASVETRPQKTNSLLTAMNDQQSLLRESRKTLKLVADLTARIESQEEKLSNSYAALENLTGLQDRILEYAGTGSEAMLTLDRMVEFQSRFVARSRDLDEAEEVARRYADLKDTLTISAKDLPIAEQNLDRWIGMQDRIVGEATTTKTAQNNLAAILDVQNRLAKSVTNEEMAFGSLEDLSRQVLNVASIHPVVANAIRALEPFAVLIKSSEAQASANSRKRIPQKVTKPQKKHHDFFSDWNTHPLGNQ